MNKTLNDYIQRSNEILNFDLSKNKKKDKYDNEYKNMISFIKSCLNNVQKNYEVFLDKSHMLDIKQETNTIHLNQEKCIHVKYDDETNQYCCSIDGIELRGNIGNIYDRNILKNDKIKAHQVSICKMGNKCHKILKEKYCKFYHDPADLLILKNIGTISEKYYENIKKKNRNFSNTSWIYTTFGNHHNMRSFGSKSTLKNDIDNLKIRNTLEIEIKNFEQQLMHDILICKYLHNLF